MFQKSDIPALSLAIAQALALALALAESGIIYRTSNIDIGRRMMSNIYIGRPI